MDGADRAMGVVNGWIAHAIPRDETEATSRASFAGRTALVTLGPVHAGRPGRARLRDRYGQSHQVLVEPDETGAQFERGSAVLLVEERGARWSVIAGDARKLDEAPT